MNNAAFSNASSTKHPKIVRVPINANINRTWEQKGKIRKVKIKKRVKSIRELEQEEKENVKKQQEEASILDNQLLKFGLLPMKEENEELDRLYKWIDEVKVTLDKQIEEVAEI